MNTINEENKNTKDPKYDYLDMQTSNAVSSTDCTGLVPANPSEDELEEYKKIIDFGNEC